VAAVWAGEAITQQDWGATTIFGLLAATLSFVGLRNLRWLSGR
jgi:hypothetical protein